MAKRKPFLKTSQPDPELAALLDRSKSTVISEQELHEQRVSFAFGNAMNQKKITKESVRRASSSIRLVRS